jgi:hypothetical protein
MIQKGLYLLLQHLQTTFDGLIVLFVYENLQKLD